MTLKTALESSSVALCVYPFHYVEYQIEVPGGQGRARLMMVPALSRTSSSEAGIAALTSSV